MLKIRLRRIGKKRTPFYRVVVAEKMTKRDGAFLETLGSYDPHANPPSAVIDAEKTREWIKKGAQPSEAAEKVLRRVGILEGPARVESKEAAPGGKGKGKDGSKAAARAAAGAAPAAAAAVAEKAAPAAEAEAEPAAPDAAAEAEAAPEAGAPATEDVMEAAVEGTPVEEQQAEADESQTPQEPGDDAAGADAPTVE